jgi:hypothetical protein
MNIKVLKDVLIPNKELAFLLETIAVRVMRTLYKKTHLLRNGKLVILRVESFYSKVYVGHFCFGLSHRRFTACVVQAQESSTIYRTIANVCILQMGWLIAATLLSTCPVKLTQRQIRVFFTVRTIRRAKQSCVSDSFLLFCKLDRSNTTANISRDICCPQ